MLESSGGRINVDEIAASMDSSPQHLFKIFEDWAGVSPEKFHQYLREKQIKSNFKSELTLFNDEPGFPRSKALQRHSDIVEIEYMSSEDFNSGLDIYYSTGNTPYGSVLIASTKKGVCSVTFLDDSASEESKLKQMFPNATSEEKACELHNQTLSLLNGEEIENAEIRLYLKGTPFQGKVWNVLLGIPEGEIMTYGSLASKMGNPKAYRAVGTAVGQNPIAYIIPCHRVVASTGVIGNYRWGTVRKAAMIGRESAGK